VLGAHDGGLVAAVERDESVVSASIPESVPISVPVGGAVAVCSVAVVDEVDVAEVAVVVVMTVRVALVVGVT